MKNNGLIVKELPSTVSYAKISEVVNETYWY